MLKFFIAFYFKQLNSSASELLHAFYFRTFWGGFVQAFLLAFTPVHLRQLGYGVAEIGLIIAISAFCTLALEIPTGVIADRYSRKKSVLYSLVCLSACGVLLSLAAVLELSPEVLFALVILSSVASGAAVAFRSGALTAWFADEVRGDSSMLSVPLKKVFAANRVLLNLGMIAGTAFVFSLDELETDYTNGLLTMGVMSLMYALLWFWVKFKMPENHFQPSESQSNIALLKNALIRLSSQPYLLGLFLVSVMVFCLMESLNTYYPVLFDEFKLPALGWSMVPVAVVAMVCARLLGSHIIAKFERIPTRFLLVFAVLLSILPLYMMNLFAGFEFYGLALLLLFFAARLGEAMNKPLLEGEINEVLPREIRATSLSVESLVGNGVLGVLLWAVPVSVLVQGDPILSVIRVWWVASALLVLTMVALFVVQRPTHRDQG